MPNKGINSGFTAPAYHVPLERAAQLVEPQASGPLFQEGLTGVTNTNLLPRADQGIIGSQLGVATDEAVPQVPHLRALLTGRSCESPNMDTSGRRTLSRECPVALAPLTSSLAPRRSSLNVQDLDVNMTSDLPGPSEPRRKVPGKSGLPDGHFLLERFQPGTSYIGKPYPYLPDGKFDMMALRFFKVPISQIDEMHYSNGSLIEKTIKARGTDGEPIIKRVIEPMSGSGAYSNYIRMLGFTGDIIANDGNPLVAITQRQIVHNYKEVLGEIKIIKEEIIAIGRSRGFDFNEELFIRDSGAKNKKAILDFREDVRDFFQKELTGTLSDDEGGELQVRDTPRAAALFYIAQNSTTHSGEIIPRYAASDRIFRSHDDFSLPINIFNASSGSDKIYALGKGVHELTSDVLEMISLMHERPAILPGPEDVDRTIIPALSGKTTFSNKGRWEIINSERVGRGDFVILSGYYDGNAQVFDGFVRKLNEYVIPAAERGASFLINNKYNDRLNEHFGKMGFLTEYSEGGYLLARNYTVNDERPSSNNIEEGRLAETTGSILMPRLSEIQTSENKRLKRYDDSDNPPGSSGAGAFRT